MLTYQEALDEIERRIRRLAEQNSHVVQIEPELLEAIGLDLSDLNVTFHMLVTAHKRVKDSQ